jgi:hypothetical protein
MGYLNKATITVDAILTNRGRELLAEGGRGSLNITKFAVADDEVDYGLYTTAHPEGSDYYGSIIENMPVLEATPDEQQIMRYKLVSLESLGAPFIADNGTIVIPTIDGFQDATLTTGEGQVRGQANTGYAPSIKTNPQYAEDYTLIVADATFFNIYQGSTQSTLLNTADEINANGSITLTFPNAVSTGAVLFNFQSIRGRTGTTTATIFGNKTGATQTISVTVQ